MTARHREGKRQLGKDRHTYLDVEGVGYLCRDCGKPKPRSDQDEESCRLEPGQAIEFALRVRRERSIPCMVLAASWHRMLPDCEFDPNTVTANFNATRQPFVGLPEDMFRTELARTAEDARKIYQAVSADTDARRHACACAMFAVQLVDLGLLDEPQNMAALIGLRILDEAEEHSGEWNYTPGVIQPLAEEMLQAAQTLGYYGMKIRSLPSV
ncbi:MAG: hypothetical protein V3S71_05510 [Acidobacteriota bacterium]